MLQYLHACDKPLRQNWKLRLSVLLWGVFWVFQSSLCAIKYYIEFSMQVFKLPLLNFFEAIRDNTKQYSDNDNEKESELQSGKESERRD